MSLPPQLHWLAQNILQPDDLDIPQTAADSNSLRSILQIVFMIAGGLAIIFAIIGGMKYVLSSGDPQQTAKAKDTIMYAIIGLILALISFVIVAVVTRTVTQ